jgi:GT2 family glycosyltransferase
MPAESTRHVRTDREYRELIHRLNQRYRQEFIRAERLQAELNRLGWLYRLFLHCKRWLPSSRDAALRPGTPPFTVLDLPALPPTGQVSIIIPFRDRLDLLRPCLRSLYRSTYRRFEVVLVDNSSSDPAMHGYLQRWMTRRHRRVVSCPDSFNFSRLCNAGAQAARGDYLLFLNNDTEVMAPDWLEALLSVAGHSQVGVVGATLFYPDLTIQHAGMFQLTDGRWEHAYRGRPYHDGGEHGELHYVRAVPAVTAACLLARRDRFFEVGRFDERLPLIHNDTDLCQRMRERGLIVAVTPHAQLLHFEGLTRGHAVGS